MELFLGMQLAGTEATKGICLVLLGALKACGQARPALQVPSSARASSVHYRNQLIAFRLGPPAYLHCTKTSGAAAAHSAAIATAKYLRLTVDKVRHYICGRY